MGRLVKIKWYNHETKKYIWKYVEKDALDQLSNIRIRKKSEEEVEEIESKLGPTWEELEVQRISEMKSRAANAAVEARRLRWHEMNRELGKNALAPGEVLAGVDLFEVDRINKMVPTERAEWVINQLLNGVKFDHVFGTDCRAQSYARPRFLFYFALHYGEGWGYSRIGKRCNKDHATVIHGCKKVVDSMPDVTGKIMEMYQTLNEIKEASK